MNLQTKYELDVATGESGKAIKARVKTAQRYRQRRLSKIDTPHG